MANVFALILGKQTTGGANLRKAIKYSKQLVEAGLSQEQAEAHLEILEEILEEDVATKEDIRNLEKHLTDKIVSVEKSLRSEIQNLELKMTVKLGMIVTIAMGGIATFFKFFI